MVCRVRQTQVERGLQGQTDTGGTWFAGSRQTQVEHGLQGQTDTGGTWFAGSDIGGAWFAGSDRHMWNVVCMIKQRLAQC